MDNSSGESNDESTSRAHAKARQLLGNSLKRIAHELRSPLSSLRLTLQICLERVQRGGEMDPRALQKALNQVDTLAATITGVCDVASLALGNVTLELEPLDIVELLQQTTEHFAGSCGTHPILFERPLAPVNVLGARHHLGQVVTSLLDNACKFSPKGTHVRVATAVDDGKVQFSVADAGIGVPISERERVFEMFFRAANATDSSTKGLGLGLFVVREIITKHSGRIWLESEPKKGSTFHVTLPIYQDETDHRQHCSAGTNA